MHRNEAIVTCAPRCKSSSDGGTGSSRKQIECSHINQIAANVKETERAASTIKQRRVERERVHLQRRDKRVAACHKHRDIWKLTTG